MSIVFINIKKNFKKSKTTSYIMLQLLNVLFFILSSVIFYRLNADWMFVIFIAEIQNYFVYFVILMLFLLETFMHASLKEQYT